MTAVKIYNNSELKLDSSIVTIGAFDGLHRGHQSLIKQAVKSAKQARVPSVVYTFNPPPRVLFQNKQVLTTVPEKVELLNGLGIDYVILANFNHAYAARGALEFIQELYEIQPKEVIVGPDFTFGKEKLGNLHFLSQYFQVTVTPFVHCKKGKIISSSRIRKLMERNEMEQVKDLLGRKGLGILNF